MLPYLVMMYLIIVGRIRLRGSVIEAGRVVKALRRELKKMVKVYVIASMIWEVVSKYMFTENLKLNRFCILPKSV